MIDLAPGKNLLRTKLQVSKYTVQAVSNRIINRNDEVRKRQRALEITAENSRELLKKLNVNVAATFQTENIFERNYFMACNHMSYLDILVLSTIQPAVFVTSVEIEKTFFLGDMAKLGGSFFVNRINRRKMKDEVDSLVELLHQKFNVFLFPEGTSTDGSGILPFKKSLFRVPFQTDFPILPICIRYKTIDGEPFSPVNCDRVCWYDDMTFAPHILQLMKLKELQVEVNYLEALNPADFESHGELSEATRDQITQAYFQN